MAIQVNKICLLFSDDLIVTIEQIYFKSDNYRMREGNVAAIPLISVLRFIFLELVSSLIRS